MRCFMKRKMFRFTTIQKVLLVFLTAIAVISTSFFTLFSYLYRNNIREIVADEMQSSLDRINEYLNLVLDNTRSMSAALMGNDILQRLMIKDFPSAKSLYTDQDFRTYATLFNDISRTNEFIVSTDLYLQDYHILLRSDLGATTRLDPSMISYFDEITEVNDDFWIAGDYNRKINEFFSRSPDSIAIIRPLYSFYTGKKAGFISMSIRTDTIQRVLNTMQGAQCIMLTEDNRLAVSSPAGETDLFDNGLFLPALPPADSVIFSTFEDTEYILAGASLDKVPWRLISYTPVDKLVHKGISLQKYLAALIISFLLIIGFSAFMVMHFITRRIHKLVGLMNQVRSGDFAVDTPDTEKDEFSYLFESFHSMAQNVDQMVNEIYHLEIMHKDVQLHLLQSQVNPHFIYNIFNNMHWLLKLKRYDDLNTIITAVSVFYSRSLNDGKLLIRIDRIMEQLNSYVQIQQIRFRNRFSFSMNVEEVLQKEEILNHLLLPLLENSIIHGIEPLTGFFHIEITGVERDGSIIFTVRDNGAGISGDILSDIRQSLDSEDVQGKYFALQNIHNRIRMFYGTEYGLTIESREGEGTCITVSIPFPKLQINDK